MKIKIFTAALLCFFSLCACRKETEVRGDVFIVTAGAGNYKLGSIEVAAFPEDTIKYLVDAKKQELTSLNTEFEAAMADARISMSKAHANSTAREYGLQNNFIPDSSYAQAQASRDRAVAVNKKIEATFGEDFFTALPPAAAAARTDADGKFVLKLPKPGKYILTARATRKVADKDEKYSWVIYFDADGVSKNVILSNNNTSDSDSKEAVFSIKNVSKL